MANSDVFHIIHLLGVIALFLDTAGALKVGESCERYSRSGEVCTKYPNCLNRVRTLVNLKKIDKDKFLSSYQDTWCGQDDEEDLICCDSPVETTVTEDVSQHPNLHLLRQDICGPISQDRVINGIKTRLFEFPWMALPLQRDSLGYSMNCGATLISDRYVLTAAHCIKGLVPNYIRLGEHNKKTEIDCEENFDGEKTTKICAPKPQEIPVDEVIVHPNYTGKPVLYHDIALVRLSHPADFTSDAVRPVCLPIGLSQQKLNLTGKMVDIAGWGTTENGNVSDELLKATIPILKNNNCTFWPPVSTPLHICAGKGTDDSSACSGDSGGPLTYIGEVEGSLRALQYGIASFTYPECEFGSVYTHVGHYMKWILDNMKP